MENEQWIIARLICSTCKHEDIDKKRMRQHVLTHLQGEMRGKDREKSSLYYYTYYRNMKTGQEIEKEFLTERKHHGKNS